VPLIDYTKNYQAKIAGLLDPADQVIAIVPYHLAHGAEKIAWTPEELERKFWYLPRRARKELAGTQPRRDRDRSLLDRVLDALSPSWPWDDFDLEKAIWGATVTGRSDSPAGRLYSATEKGSAERFGVVTAHRFAVLKKVGLDRFELVAEARRAEVVSVRRQGRPFQRGRVVIEFADGSHLAVLCGLLLTGQARRLVTALSPQ
jgi:hypothetical protein